MNEYVFEFFGEIGKWSYGASYLKYFLKQAGENPVRMRLSSCGGEVHEALLCADAIRKHGNVVIEIVGKCASAATFMAFSAKSIEIQDDAFFLVHNCSQWIEVWGRMTKEQIQQKIEELQSAKKSNEAIDMVITQKYVDRSGKSLEEVTALMKENRWMTASEAHEWGFVDSVIENQDKKKPTTNQIQTMMAMGLPAFPESESGDAGSRPDESFWNKLLNYIKPKADEGGRINNNNSVMRTEEKSVCQLLNVTGLEEKDGKISLTIDQLKAIENRFTQSETEMQATIGERDRYAGVLDTLGGDIRNADTVDGKIAAFNAFVARIPVAGVVVRHEYKEGETDYSSVATDPVNFAEE